MGSPAGSGMARRWAREFFPFQFYGDGHCKLPAAGNTLAAVGKEVRHGEATSYRDL